ncbi:hypothetical protein CL622_05090 [archaeon]|nr:hypothetical protein [archaeon]
MNDLNQADIGELDRINVSLGGLKPEQRLLIKNVLIGLRRGELSKLGDVEVKKLKDRDDIYRIRQGAVRVTCQVKNGQVHILALERLK